MGLPRASSSPELNVLRANTFYFTSVYLMSFHAPAARSSCLSSAADAYTEC